MRKIGIQNACLAILYGLICSATVFGDSVKLAAVPSPLPDGKGFVFVWNGDIWSASAKGGEARQLTRHPAMDHWPCVSSDGRMLAFAGKRDNTYQVYIMPVAGGTPRKVTFHTEGATPLCWFPDGKSILVRAIRDHVGVGQLETRFFKVPIDGKGREILLFDAYGKEADISPDGKKVLFTRDGVDLYRKGYQGSLASKIWLYDMESQSFQLLRSTPGGDRSPMWRPDGKAFYYVSQESGCFNVWEQILKSGKTRQLTHFKDDAVILPRLSRNGKTMIFRQLFDFYRLDPTKSGKPVRIPLSANRDRVRETVRRRWYTSLWNNNAAGSLDWTRDGLQMCFTTGGDLWVMDTILREPVAVTKESGIHETEAVFAPDGQAIYFLRDFGDRVNVWRAEKSVTNAFWWRQKDFELSAVTDDDTGKYNLSTSPSGSNIAYCVERGRIQIADLDGSHSREVAKSVYEASYDWSPDGRWMVCSLSDADGNRDIWIISTTGAREPYNLSRHPSWDGDAHWSPDGRKIAFVGRRHDRTVGIYYVYLQEKDEAHTGWNLKLEQALDAMKPGASKDKKNAKNGKANSGESPLVRIDFDGLHDRIHRIGVDRTSGNLFWSYDSKALAYQATIGGKSGTWKSVFPDHLKPAFMSDKSGMQAKWIKQDSKVMWAVDKKPANYNKLFPFSAFQETHIADYQRLAFRQIWRALRDRFYDPRMNNLNWRKILEKYEDMAASAPNREVFSRTVSMLLGELNASHMGFLDNAISKKEWGGEWKTKDWNIRTGHTGLLFDEFAEGPGIRVRHVVESSPADQNTNRILEAERILKIDGESVDSHMAWYKPLTGSFPRENELTVLATNGEIRAVMIRTIGYEEARDLMREESIMSLGSRVNTLSDGRLGYLHIARMQWEDFYKFEQEVFARGFGKDGLVIDVRGNPGGFVADRLLEILCHPQHAITRPREGTVSYPIGYLGKAIWNKPIVVLCNQYTGSNGEIFCHAIKTLKRGKLVGVPTRGGVISTPTINILDLGSLSIPDRGWFVITTGQDMELNGCVPDEVVRRGPADVAMDQDPQLEKAVQVLITDIQAVKEHPQPKPIKASERGAPPAVQTSE